MGRGQGNISGSTVTPRRKEKETYKLSLIPTGEHAPARELATSFIWGS